MAMASWGPRRLVGVACVSWWLVQRGLGWGFAPRTPSPVLPRTSVRRSASTAASGCCLGEEVRGEFPVLGQRVNEDKALVYLDSAATSQKPQSVLDAMDAYYREANANVHRGAHALANRATELYEGARDKVAQLVHAERREEIVFTRGASEAINLVVQTWGAANLGPGDEVVLSVLEHHSNIVPWQLLAARLGFEIKFVGLDADQRLDMAELEGLLSPRTKFVSVCHASNVLGFVTPVKRIVELAHGVGAKVLLDACQSVPHMPVDVQAIGCDFLVASSHKMCGPTGIGFLYGRYDLLEAMPPWQGGGEMIDEVFLTHSTFAPPPGRFEAGTPAIAEAVGLGAACDFLTSVGMENVEAHVARLSNKLWHALHAVDGLELYGPPPCEDGSGRTGLVCFNSQAVHASDLNFFLDQEGLALRTGHHCTQPLHRQLGIAGSMRASLYLYNTEDEIDTLIEKLRDTLNMFAEMG